MKFLIRIPVRPLLALKQHYELTKRKWLVRLVKPMSKKSKLSNNKITVTKTFAFLKNNEKYLQINRMFWITVHHVILHQDPKKYVVTGATRGANKGLKSPHPHSSRFEHLTPK